MKMNIIMNSNQKTYMIWNNIINKKIQRHNLYGIGMNLITKLKIIKIIPNTINM
jgi:hypothetical protein